MSLKDKKCRLAKSGDEALSVDDSKKLMTKINTDWALDAQNGVLTRTFVFKNFKDPLHLLIQISKIAEEENHHPVLKLAYGILEVSIWTHKVNGLMESDFIFAAKVDYLCDTLSRF